MRAEPFEDVPHIKEASIKFTKFLQDILDSNGHVRESISRRPKGGSQITDEMNKIRGLGFEGRKNVYLSMRINDQRNWYLSKVKDNRYRFRRWVSVCVFLQGFALILAVVRIQYPEGLAIWPTEPVLVMASAVIGWIQIKKFNELASAYSLTAHEIGLIQERIKHITESELSDFINEAERAFSREHTQWVARQNN